MGTSGCMYGCCVCVFVYWCLMYGVCSMLNMNEWCWSSVHWVLGFSLITFRSLDCNMLFCKINIDRYKIRLLLL